MRGEGEVRGEGFALSSTTSPISMTSVGWIVLGDMRGEGKGG